MTTLVLFDLEFTSWAGALEGDWSAPGQLREIVQIGAVRLRSDTYEVVEHLDVVVRPVRNPVLSHYLTELTGIDQPTIDGDGVDAATALGSFLAFCAGQATFSYGNDMVVLGENVGWARARGDHVAHGFLTASFTNLRPMINTVAPATATANVGRLWSSLGLPRPDAPGGQHSALFDCYSFAAAVRHLCADADSVLARTITATVAGSSGLGGPDPRTDG